MSRKAIDVGNFTIVPSPQQVRDLMDLGYAKAIVGTSFGSVWAQQIAMFEAQGMDVAEYQFPSVLKPTSREWWLDCETQEATVTRIRTICSATNVTGIYTRRSWWVDNTNDWNIVAEFPHLKLWDASYGDPPPAFIPYGGFTSRAMHQWHDSTILCGLNVDLNIIEEEPAAPVEEDDGVKPVLVFNTTDKSIYLVGFQQPILIGDPAEVAQLEKAYGAQIALSDGTMKAMVP